MERLLAQLEQLADAGAIDAIDVEFARVVARLATHAPREAALAACLASAHVGAGNVCADLRALAGAAAFDAPELRDAVPRVPRYDVWRKALLESGVVTQPGGERAPLVLDERGRLFLYRYWNYEREVAQELRRRAALETPSDPDEEARLAVRLAAVFTDDDDRAADVAAREADGQRVAAAIALLRPFTVISGGPGTGKTTTVVRILALLVEQAHERGEARYDVRLAAPTGKAAARIQEAVRAAKARLADRFAPDVLAAVPDGASTVHRLLGPRRDSSGFRHDRKNPLAVDALVVDEASMVDLALMAKLLRALPPAAKLILVGDKDQLASVEAGAVLGDICGDPVALSPPLRARLTALCGAPPAAVRAAQPSESPLRDSIALLHRSYRFGPQSGIGELARCVNEGRGEDALALLAAGCHADVAWREIGSPAALRAALRATVAESFGPSLELARDGASPAEVFAAFNRFRVLCAVRRGEFGVERTNELITRLLDDAGLAERRADWYPGRPVMIARNDYGLRLWNGDVGIALIDEAGRLRVHFEPGDGAARAFPPVRLPQHEPVFAMTIHKSQGSEFGRVVVVLPAERSRALGRELLYTGITRARDSLEIWATRDSILEATRKPFARGSGLRDALWAE